MKFIRSMLSGSTYLSAVWCSVWLAVFRKFKQLLNSIFEHSFWADFAFFSRSGVQSKGSAIIVSYFIATIFIGLQGGVKVSFAGDEAFKSGGGSFDGNDAFLENSVDFFTLGEPHTIWLQYGR